MRYGDPRWNGCSGSSIRCARTPIRRRAGSGTCARRCRSTSPGGSSRSRTSTASDGKKHPWERPWSYGWGQMRVGALIRREQGNDAVDRWYAAVGHAFFDDGREDPRSRRARGGHRARPASIPTLVERAIADPTTTDDVRADHDEVVARYGGHGVPTIVFESGLRGVRTGRRARARRATTRSRSGTSCAACSGSRTSTSSATRRRRDDLRHIAEQFRTYVTTRDWKTIEKPGAVGAARQLGSAVHERDDSLHRCR